jgi:Ni/Co efflux regulator RcnB
LEIILNIKTVLSLVIAASLATGGSAFGQGYRDGGDRGRHAQAQRGAEHDRRDHNDRRRWDRHQYQVRAQDDERRDERGAGPHHDFHRGGRLPAEYRHTQYVVDDWRGHNLRAPPRGYHWVQTGGDYVLVAIATGIILQLLLNH